MAVTHSYLVQVDTFLAAVIAVVVLMSTCRYARQFLGFVIGLNRREPWVAACAGLSAEGYPPVGLDGAGPGPAAMTMPPVSPGPGSGVPTERPAASVTGAAPGGPRVRTPDQTAAVVTGTVLALCSIGLLGVGGAALWADTADRHGGYVSLGSENYHSTGYAVATDAAELHAAGTGWDAARPLFGTLRIRATSTPVNKPTFIGIAAPGPVSDYLTGVAHTIVRSVAGTRGVSVEVAGTAPAMPPTREALWVEHSSGSGTQTLIWPASSGNWEIVLMNADGSRPVSVSVDIAARLPALTGIAVGLLAAGAVSLAAGVTLMVITLRPAPRRNAPRHRK